MLPQYKSEAPQTTYSSTAKPQVKEKRAVRRNVCVRHCVPTYLLFWNCTGKTEIKTERVWWPLDKPPEGKKEWTFWRQTLI